MKTLVQKSGSLVLATVLAVASLNASANVTLDDVTDYYLYETLVQSEFDLDNKLVNQVDASSEASLTEQSLLIAQQRNEETMTIQQVAE
ncbi:hypothetical protein [Planctobacterium marinum]|uniref:Uncharacterized protein n=1 Tax=Planctobacterium marinum TaxID=1631968 RepID=A0AA48HM66_9ALTE|nr:hypothetical protein MACH26_16180 [Planctobacterium marinum]